MEYQDKLERNKMKRKIMSKLKYFLDKKGQGLLETIIALGVIVSGIVGMLSLAISNQASSAESAERLIASHLAREGIEVIRNKRDNNWFVGAVWDSGLKSGTNYSATLLFSISTNVWSLDFTPNAINHNYCRLWRQGGVYFQSTLLAPSGALLTPYRRIVFLDEICKDKTVASSGSSCPGLNPKIGIRVQSVVEWDSRGKTIQIVAEEHLFNWR
jgi:hypothetical protein